MPLPDPLHEIELQMQDARLAVRPLALAHIADKQGGHVALKVADPAVLPILLADPAAYRVVLFEQRGAGRSTPAPVTIRHPSGPRPAVQTR